MRVSLNNNINFGYDKRLNQKLNNRLNNSEQTPTTKLIGEMNSTCNSVESMIIQLENPSSGGVDRNEEQINILLSYFLSAKRTLCHLVDRIFPDLNFMKKTIDTLDKEEVEKAVIYESEPPQEVNKLCYKWREVLFQQLDDDLESKANLSTPNGLSGVGVGFGEDGAQNSLLKFEPSSSSPKSLDDVIGLDKYKNKIRTFLIFPLENPKEAKQRELDYGIKIPGFSVFFGPPGCGKTMLAQAIAAESKCDMYMLDLSQVGSTYVNGTVINIAKAFKELEEIAQKSPKPVLLFMDEMDSLMSKRDGSESKSEEDNKVVNTLLPLITRAQDKNILIIGATNMYNALDPAITRRIKFKPYIGLPNESDIKKLLIKELSKFKMGQNLAQDNEALEELSKKLVSYSPSNIVDMVSLASEYAYFESREVQAKDIEEALKDGNFEKINEEEYLPQNKKQNKIIKGFLKAD